ncbi:MAG: NapC/NirT family cytochrome c [Desulfoarculaceae bacterium]|nr:NapC/NirT family cytochrome c [Desulfoarculaceae bacterium]
MTDLEQKEEDVKEPEVSPVEEGREIGAWERLLGCTWRTPLGFLGVTLTTVSITLIVLGLIAHLSGLISNHYFAIFIFLFLPGMMMLGLGLIPLAYYFRQKKWFKDSLLNVEHLKIDLADKHHRKGIILFLVLSVINVTVLVLVAYEGYHFTDSSYFCGVVCHEVMDPEYTAYQRSPHAKVPCVSCHIGPGADWYVRAKLSGLRQVKAVIDGEFSRPIPAPVEHLRPARDTCESCHWPEKFHGKRVKEFISYTNNNQTDPNVQEVALRIGGRNPVTNDFEGIHWHVSRDIKVEYQPLDEKRTKIGTVKVTRPGGITEEYALNDEPAEEGVSQEWRTMDCIDCHNRPTHVYDDLERVVDFGLHSQKLNPEIKGIREDSIAILQIEYTSRDEATEKIVGDLLERMAKRHGADFVAEHQKELVISGSYLLEVYLNNVWPKMKVTWGTYRQHLGHQNADEGYGCFRCHDDEHKTKFGKIIRQDCNMCHDEPQ